MKIGGKHKMTREQAALQAEEAALVRQQREQVERQNAATAQEEARQAERAALAEQARLAGRAGRRSLFSGDFAGFRRGGDLGGA